MIKRGLVLAFGFVFGLQGQPVYRPSLDDPAIGYTGETRDAVSLLRGRLEKGQTQLEWSEKFGYLESVLKELHVPVSSQMLVFSKTSLQIAKISPEHPRALYFNDEVYIGFVRGGLLELAAVDPAKGAVFYVMEQKKTAKPQLLRKDADCLQCHFTLNTMQTPGFLTRSVYATRGGEVIPEAGGFFTDQHSPLEQRWGGWFVTGTSGMQRHLGNEFASGGKNRINMEHGSNVTDLKGRVNTSPYPAPESDLTALMVLNHQVGMHNLITRMGYEARLGREELPRTIEASLRYMLFMNEAQLRDETKGTSSFRADFEALGPKDSQGRSLRQMDMKTRMFRYPCSFLIYSEAFDALPAAAKDPFLRRLWEILSGKDQSVSFSGLSAGNRQAILEILVDTKKGLPEYFRATR